MSSEEFGYKLNQEMKEELKAQKFKNERLRRLLEVFTGDSIDGETKDRMAEWLAGEFREETEEFLIDLERMRSERLSLNRAKDHLHEHYGLDRDAVEEIEGTLDLVLTLYELKYSNEIDAAGFSTLIAYSSIFAEKSQEVYILEEDIELEDVEEDVQSHLSETNNHHRHALGARVHPKESGVQIKLYSEYGRKPYVSFSFREDGTETPPNDPEVEYEPSYPLKTIQLELRKIPEGVEVVFSKDPLDGWKTRLEEFFQGTFSITDVFQRLERRESEVAGEIRSVAKEAAENDEDAVEQVEESLGSRREELVENLREDEDLEEDEVAEAEERLETVRLAGFIISDDQNTQTDDFRLVSDNFSGFLDSVDSMDDGLEAYLKEADDENVQVVVEIEDEKVRIQGDTWSPLYGKMSTENLDTLRLFFDTLRNE
ncbi:hypothetical protein C455_00047 [Haloferax larsenii JCM 13917]|nr:hypothetical protein [Haloferax larsenii]ELZ84476.1 hypothetical protein C455_00047 [Haloferax larsenii JCM 13917]